MVTNKRVPAPDCGDSDTGSGRGGGGGSGSQTLRLTKQQRQKNCHEKVAPESSWYSVHPTGHTGSAKPMPQVAAVTRRPRRAAPWGALGPRWQPRGPRVFKFLACHKAAQACAHRRCRDSLLRPGLSSPACPFKACMAAIIPITLVMMAGCCGATRPGQESKPCPQLGDSTMTVQLLVTGLQGARPQAHSGQRWKAAVIAYPCKYS